MSVAAPELDLNGVAWSDLPDGNRRWHVLQVKSRQEKALANDLRVMGVAHYLPLLSKTRLQGNRKFAVEEPLFGGYLFLLGEIDEAYLADRTRRVANIIHVSDQRRLHLELRNIHLALLNRACLDPYPFLKTGLRVVVKAGPFMGVEGVIENRRANRLILQVGMLGAAACLEIDAALLEPLD